MSEPNPKIDRLLQHAKSWQEEMMRLRAIVLDCDVEEEVKWRQPCYTHDGKNIVIIGAFKEYCSLLFMKGALLKDTKGLLVRPGENSQSGRLLKFTSVAQIEKMEKVIKAYVNEAIQAEKAGLKVPKKTTADFVIPEEFQAKLDKKPALKKAFTALTPGRQRAYLLYFSGAKQSKTREARVEKCIPQILSGKGMDD